MAIRINESLGLLNKITRAVFCSVVAGKYNLMFFFFAEKAVDACREVVGGQYSGDQKNMVLARFHFIFSQLLMSEKLISFMRKLVSFRKCK